MSDSPHEEDIKQLNSFLRGEISAVETYEQALDSVDHATAERVLRQNHVSHNERVTLIRSEIQRLGGEPVDGSGAWGSLAKAIQGGAKLFGDSAAVAALEEGEDHGLKNYREDLDELAPPTRNFVSSRLAPEQQRTHDALSQLKELMD